MIEHIEDEDIELEPFDDRFEWFFNNEIPRISCNTLEERDAVLNKLNARIGAISYIDKSNEKLVLCRTTDQENVLVEDIVNPNDWLDVSWLIYRTDLEDDN